MGMFTEYDEDKELVRSKSTQELVIMYNKETYWKSISPDVIFQELRRRGVDFRIKKGFYSDYDDGDLVIN
jgi:hypothetical protein